ncbi:MAG: T9SS type A sorting domain-containing protein [Bacteroidales bacterium]|nr:T9SS type A sorting domain-containing protein [Bacteroidales bacterium]
MNKKPVFLLALLLLTILSPKAQMSFVAYDTVPVFSNDTLLQNPWAGGLNCPQFSQIDLDGDGKLDLVTFERDFYGSVKTFINKGNSGEVNYVHTPEYQPLFPEMRNWMMLRDYNCDGKMDIFTSVPAGVAVYRNDAGEGEVPAFTKVEPLLRTQTSNGKLPLFISTQDVPAISDIDHDGDLDILSFNTLGSRVEYHQNMTMENHSDCGHLDYKLQNPCWGYFSEAGNTNNVNLYDTCDTAPKLLQKSAKHAGSTLLAIDLSGNGVKDLLLGDITYPNLVKLTNGGTTDQAGITDVEINFPANSQPVDLTVFPAPYFLDVNNDDLKDLIVAPNNPNTSENHNNVWYYRNEGTADVPEFQLQHTGFLQQGMIDAGERSYPAFLDENADGLMDIIIGNFGYFENAGEYSSQLMLLRNTGTSEAPTYTVVTDDYAELSEPGFDGIYPAFGDMDGDDDPDMLIGDEEGRLHYFRNDGGEGNPADFTISHPNYFEIDIGQSAKPQLVDVNNDGLLDIVVGEREGTINYFKNTGTAEEAQFSSSPTNEQFGGIDVMKECCTGYSAPFMTYDSLGNKIMYVGSEQGKLYRYTNIDNNLEGTFSLSDSLYLHGTNVAATGTDINGDGKNELAYGEFAGGIGLLKEGTPPGLGFRNKNTAGQILKIYPNPAKDAIRIEPQTKTSDSEGSITITNIYGQQLIKKPFGIYREKIHLNIEGLPPGAYLIRLVSNEYKASGKFIKE